MVINIGDTFRIDMTETYVLYPNLKKCKYPTKTFVVDKFSKSSMSVYYLDNRTSSKCKCELCINTDNNSKRIKLRCISINEVVITETKLQRERDIKLRQILK